MSKITLTDLTTLTNEQSAVAAINNNNAAIQTASNNFLSLDGTSPNSMTADLDMNGNNILNLPDPASDTEPVTLGFGDTRYGNAAVYADSAEASADAAAISASNAATSASNASTSATAASNSASSASSSATAAAAAVNAVAIKYTWSTSTSSTNQGSGKIWVNNASPGSATTLYINETDASGNAIASEIARWDDATNASGRARVRIAKDDTNFLLLTITSAITDSGSYDSFTVGSGAMVGSFNNNDTVYVQALTSGADGSGGDFSSNTATSVDGEIVLFSGTGGKTGKRATGTGVAKITSGVLGTATAGTDYASPGANTDITSVVLSQTGLAVKGGPTNTLTLKPNETLSAARTLNLIVNDTNRTINLSGDLTVSGAHTAPAGTSAVLSGGQTITGGFTGTSYSIGTVTGAGQTITPTLSNSNFQHCTLNGSSLTGTLTFAVPSGVGTVIVEVVNGGSGAVGATLSTSGYTKVDGSYATTNGNKYQFVASRTNTYSYLNIVALQ